VVITSHTLTGDPARWPKLPPLGQPIANTRIHILDEDGRPVAIGEPGEIYVGGACLARGYLNRPELTAGRFVPDPFGDEPAGRLYRTGDLARYLPDGNIEFLGRMDHQVKVRGFRIELGEIEAALDQHPDIRQAAVTAREDSAGDRRLVAYVVPSGDAAPDAHALRDFLKARLPEYMLPTAFVTLDTLPLTPNGKIDAKALPPPLDERPPLAQPYLAPGDPAERGLAAIWSDVLGIRPIGVEDDFFDLGGDSLKATRVLARVEGEFGVRFPHPWLFEGPTVARMAERLRAARAEALPDKPIARAVEREAVAPVLGGGGDLGGGAAASRAADLQRAVLHPHPPRRGCGGHGRGPERPDRSARGPVHGVSDGRRPASATHPPAASPVDGPSGPASDAGHRPPCGCGGTGRDHGAAPLRSVRPTLAARPAQPIR
jgi:acyl carrier protein